MSWLFTVIYKRWLFDEWSGKYSRVIRVKGWRTALVERPGGERMTMSPCFWGLQ